MEENVFNNHDYLISLFTFFNNKINMVSEFLKYRDINSLF